MNENLNLVEILKDCPKGMELDCTVYNDVTFLRVDDVQNRCYFKAGPADTFWTTCEGRINGSPYGKCVVFPKGKTTWECFKPKKPKFDPKTLKPFDKVLVRDRNTEVGDVAYFHILSMKIFHLHINVLVIGIDSASPTTITQSTL